jgi:hypothetical protein
MKMFPSIFNKRQTKFWKKYFIICKKKTLKG